MGDIFGSLQALRAQPVPAQAPVRQQFTGVRQYALNLHAPQNAEPLVDLSSYGIKGKNFYAQPNNPPYYTVAAGAIPQLFARQTVAEKLAQLNEKIRTSSLELYVFDAWRPTAVQKFFYEEWMPAQLRAQYPDWSDAQIKAETGKYWAAPTTSASSPAAHNTGGAVDVRLQWLDGEPLWFGTMFDEFSAAAAPDYYESAAAPLSFSDAEARANRRLLYWLMTAAGFAQHPNEWWHYSYGDQVWAHLTNAPHAFYGTAEPERFI